MAVNWETVKTEYITTDTSQRKLAAKYDIPLSNITRRCKDEKWVEQREQYKRTVTAKAVKKSATRDANRLARLMDTTTKAIDVAARAFEDEQQFNRYLVETGPKEYRETVEQTFAKVDTKALRDLTAVLKDLTGLMREFYDIPTPAQAEARRIAAERLAMEQRRAAASENDVNEVEVIFAAGEEAWNE